MTTKINIGGEDRPANLNGYALELLAEYSGKNFTDFFNELEGMASKGFDMKAINTLLYCALAGGALEDDLPFDLRREKVATWVNMGNMGSVLEQLMGIVTASMPAPETDTKPKKKAAVAKP